MIYVNRCPELLAEISNQSAGGRLMINTTLVWFQLPFTILELVLICMGVKPNDQETWFNISSQSC